MLTIGEFSKLGAVSARMLRYYDALGLLRPAHTGEENGYRYYDEAQLAVLSRIEELRRYGFILAEVAQLLPLDKAELARRIHARRVQAYAQLHEMRGAIRRMEEDIIRMEGTDMAKEAYHVIVMDAPEHKVFGIRRTINVAQTHELFQELRAEMKRLGLKRTGAEQLAYLGDEFDYDHMEVEAQVFVEGDAPGVHVIPAGQYAATTHTGPYESVKYAYDALCAWLGEHTEYQVCGPGLERYLKDENTVQSPEEYETGVLFPVRRVEK